MTYKQFTNKLLEYSVSHGLIESVDLGDSVFEVNYKEKLYPIAQFTPGVHRLGNPLNTFTFTIFYIDKLLNDKSNTVDAQDAGFKFTADLLRYVQEVLDVELDFPEITAYTEKFADDCAGTFCTVSFRVFTNWDTDYTLINAELSNSDNIEDRVTLDDKDLTLNNKIITL